MGIDLSHQGIDNMHPKGFSRLLAVFCLFKSGAVIGDQQPDLAGYFYRFSMSESYLERKKP